MKRSEEVANELFPRNIDEPDSLAEAVGRQAVIDGYELAEEFFISKLKEYIAKGEKFMEDVVDNDGTYQFWDGFHNCAENLLREFID